MDFTLNGIIEEAGKLIPKLDNGETPFEIGLVIRAFVAMIKQAQNWDLARLLLKPKPDEEGKKKVSWFFVDSNIV